MGDTPMADQWPQGSRYALWRGSSDEPVVLVGSLDHRSAWASVSKVAVAYAVARAVDDSTLDLGIECGPPGSTLRHLLAHASGLGMEEGDRCAPVGTRRVYSNIGIDVAVATACAATDANGWLSSQVNGALGFSVNFSGRASSGASGSLNELGALGRAWLRSQNLIPSTRDEFVDPFLANLAGVVPGFGRFDPCPWGLGVEIHGQKHHWMGSKFSSRAYGHFGQSGSLLLIDPDADVVVAALAGENFGPWAQSLWPLWTDELFNEFVA